MRSDRALGIALALSAAWACRTASPELADPSPPPPPAPPAREAPIALAPGTRAASPLPYASAVDFPDLRIEVQAVERGDTATRRARAAGMPASAVGEGRELLLLQLRVQGMAGTSSVDCRDLRVAGSGRVVHFHTPKTLVTPALETGDVAAGEIREGWCAYEIPATERELVLLLNEPASRDPSGLRYLALEPGAAISPASIEIPADAAGASAGDAAPLGTEVVTDEWSVTALDVVRGEAAREIVLGANAANAPPADGFEFLVVKLRARYLGGSGLPGLISPAQFKTVSQAGEPYPRAIAIDMQPRLTRTLLPGGEHTGVAVFQVPRGEPQPLLRFRPFHPDEGERFLALRRAPG